MSVIPAAFERQSIHSDTTPHIKLAMVTSGSPYLQAIKNTALGAFLESQVVKPPAELMQLTDELSLVRETAIRSVTLYAAARDAELKNPDNAKMRLVADQAAALMNMSMHEVAGICEQAARVASTVNRAFSWGYINQIVLVMMRAIHEAVGDRPDILDAINRRMSIDFDQLKAVSNDDHELAMLLDEMNGSVPMNPDCVDALQANGSITGANGCAS